MPASSFARSAPGEDQILAMSVRDIGFLLDRLGEDCHPRVVTPAQSIHVTGHARIGGILGAEVEQQQTAVSWRSMDHVLEECLARAIEPVKIFRNKTRSGRSACRGARSGESSRRRLAFS